MPVVDDRSDTGGKSGVTKTVQSEDDFVLGQDAYDEQDQRQPRHDRYGPVVLLLEVGAYIGRTPQAGKPRDYADEEKLPGIDRRQPRYVNQGVFGNAGNQEKDKHGDLGFRTVDQEIEFL